MDGSHDTLINVRGPNHYSVPTMAIQPPNFIPSIRLKYLFHQDRPLNVTYTTATPGDSDAEDGSSDTKDAIVG